MGFSAVSFANGTGPLGSWGRIDLTGAESALLRPPMAENIWLPAPVARHLVSGVLLLNNQAGRLLFLPHDGEVVAAYDLTTGLPLFEPFSIPRDEDEGFRMGWIRAVATGGVVYLTERTVARFADDATLIWRHDDDFDVWVLDDVTEDAVVLARGGSGPREQRYRSLADGCPLT